jgi:excisionase family DNA binding protein
MKKIHTVTDTEFLTAKEAAKELGIESQSMRDHLSKGTFTTYKFKTLTLIKTEDVERWKKERSRK